jgi:hypothetical protein
MHSMLTVCSIWQRVPRCAAAVSADVFAKVPGLQGRVLFAKQITCNSRNMQAISQQRTLSSDISFSNVVVEVQNTIAFVPDAFDAMVELPINLLASF